MSDDIKTMDELGMEANPRPASEIFTYIWNNYSQTFKMNVEKLSNKDLRRLVLSLVMYPIDEKAHFSAGSSKEVLEAYFAGEQLMQAKCMMLMNQLIAASNEPSAVEGGENNG